MKKNKYRVNDVGAVTETKTLKSHKRKQQGGKIEQQSSDTERQGFGNRVGGPEAYRSTAARADG